MEGTKLWIGENFYRLLLVRQRGSCAGRDGCGSRAGVDRKDPAISGSICGARRLQRLWLGVQSADGASTVEMFGLGDRGAKVKNDRAARFGSCLSRSCLPWSVLRALELPGNSISPTHYRKWIPDFPGGSAITLLMLANILRGWRAICSHRSWTGRSHTPRRKSSRPAVWRNLRERRSGVQLFEQRLPRTRPGD